MSKWRDRLTRPLAPDEAARIRVHVWLVPVYIWLFVAWSFYAVDITASGRFDRAGHVKGHDFLHFYILGQVALDRAPADLYSFAAQAARVDRLLPDYPSRFFPVHPPQVAIFLSPLATLPYVAALAIWLAISAAVCVLCFFLLWRVLPRLRPHTAAVVVCCVGSPAFFALIAAGQTSAFALLWFTLAYLALRREQFWIAGACLGALIYKPTLGLVLPFAFLAARQWRVIGGALASIAAQALVAWVYFGSAALVGYVRNFERALTSVDQLEAQPFLMHSLRSFFSLLLPWPRTAAILYGVASVATIVLAVRTWRSSASLEVRYAVLLIATVLVSPHVYLYELVVMIPAFFLAAHAAISCGTHARYPWMAIYLAYLAPTPIGVTPVMQVQWSVLAIALLMIVLARLEPAPAARISA